MGVFYIKKRGNSTSMSFLFASILIRIPTLFSPPIRDSGVIQNGSIISSIIQSQWRVGRTLLLILLSLSSPFIKYATVPGHRQWDVGARRCHNGTTVESDVSHVSPQF